MKDWYQYRPWNLTHRVQLRESRHMTYHTVALLPNSCGPMADGPFRDPKGRSYPHPKYWTHRWRIDINNGHGISPIETNEENKVTWHIIRRHYYQIASAQWRMIHFVTPRVGPIHTPNIGHIEEGLISITAMKFHPLNPVKRIKAHDISYYNTMQTVQIMPICDSFDEYNSIDGAPYFFLEFHNYEILCFIDTPVYWVTNLSFGAWKLYY